MRALGCRRGSARQKTRDHHEAGSADFAGMARQSGCARGVLRAGPNDHLEASTYQSLNALHALLVRQERPISHGACVHDSRHAERSQFNTLGHKRIEVRFAVGAAWGHQRWYQASKYSLAHRGPVFACQGQPSLSIANPIATGPWACWRGTSFLNSGTRLTGSRTPKPGAARIP
jgi:hypothetical protein